jgi:MacB-like periplasmic core domain
LGSIAAARRTNSSFSTYLASTNPSNLTVVPGPANAADNYSPATTTLLAHLPGVKHLEDGSIQTGGFPLGPNGLPRISSRAVKDVTPLASVNGLDFTEDRVTVIAGRMANPSNPDQIVMTSAAAKLLGVHVGSRIPLGFYTPEQLEDLPGNDIPTVKPRITVNARVVGLVVFNDQVVHDDIDQYPTYMLYTPALARELLRPPLLGNEGWTEYGLQLDHGNADVAEVEQEIGHALPKNTLLLFVVTSLIESEAQRAVAPDVIVLWGFGVIASIAAILVALLIIIRQLQVLETDREAMVALGADRRMTTADALIGIVGAIFLGSLLADLVAISLSPLAPIGPVRSVYPSLGIAFDWTVLGFGLLGLIVVLVGTSAALAFRLALRETAEQGQRVARSSTAVRAVAASGLPASAVAGVRFALAPGPSRSSGPVRSAIFGAMLAIIILVATLTFGASLQTLVSQPALYGWNWSYALQPVSDPVSYTPPRFQELLREDSDVESWTPVQFFTLSVNGQAVPFMFEPPKSSIAPPILSGHAVLGPDQVVIGPATLESLHKSVGDTVTVSYDGSGGTLRIVGTATFPAIGVNGTFHPSTGTGAVASTQILPVTPDPVCGEQADMVLIRMRSTVTSADALANAQRIATDTNQIFASEPASSNCSDDLVSVLPVQQPAEIAYNRSVGATPLLLVASLVLAAIVALGLTLIASVRRRRRDLATLKALGFTGRQLLHAVCWQSSVAVGSGVVLGVPLGIVLGRWLWTLFARDIYVVAAPTVPIASVVLVVIGSLLFANLVAIIPGRIAARTSTADVLRSE